MDKKATIFDICQQLLTLEIFKLRFVAKLIVKLVPSLLAVQIGELFFYRYLKISKIAAFHVKTLMLL